MRKSSSRPPTPSPRASRTPEGASKGSAYLASTPAWRSGATRMKLSSRTHYVAPAAAASVTSGS